MYMKTTRNNTRGLTLDTSNEQMYLLTERNLFTQADIVRKDVDRTINNYEATIKSMKEENEKVADEYDVKIDELQVKNNRIVKRIEDRISCSMRRRRR